MEERVRYDFALLKGIRRTLMVMHHRLGWWRHGQFCSQVPITRVGVHCFDGFEFVFWSIYMYKSSLLPSFFMSFDALIINIIRWKCRRGWIHFRRKVWRSVW